MQFEMFGGTHILHVVTMHKLTSGCDNKGGFRSRMVTFEHHIHSHNVLCLCLESSNGYLRAQ